VLAKVFMFRSCTGPEPGRRSGSPCLDYYIKRCEAPCVGYVSKEEYRASIDGVVDFLSGASKAIERELDERMRAAAAAEEFEQATGRAQPLRAVHSLLERRRVANEAVGHVRRDRGGGRRARRQRAGLSGAETGCCRIGQSFYLSNETERNVADGRRGVHAAVLRGAQCRSRRCWWCSAPSTSAPRSRDALASLPRQDRSSCERRSGGE